MNGRNLDARVSASAAHWVIPELDDDLFCLAPSVVGDLPCFARQLPCKRSTFPSVASVRGCLQFGTSRPVVHVPHLT